MNAIVAVDLHWGIGKDHNLLYRIPEDLQYFRSLTLDQTVVCGRKTLHSFPNHMPLPRRRHIVLSRSITHDETGVLYVPGIDRLMEEIKSLPSDQVWLIGGESVYRQLYCYCQKIYVTQIFSDRVKPDAYFPDLSRDPRFALLDPGTVQTSRCGIDFAFRVYQNTKGEL